MQKEGEEEEVVEVVEEATKRRFNLPTGLFLGADSLCASPQLLCSFLLSAALLLLEWP